MLRELPDTFPVDKVFQIFSKPQNNIFVYEKNSYINDIDFTRYFSGLV